MNLVKIRSISLNIINFNLQRLGLSKSRHTKQKNLTYKQGQDKMTIMLIYEQIYLQDQK